MRIGRSNLIIYIGSVKSLLTVNDDRCETLPEDLPDDMDLMIEAKDKEQAVLHLYRIYQLETVIHGTIHSLVVSSLCSRGSLLSPMFRQSPSTSRE